MTIDKKRQEIYAFFDKEKIIKMYQVWKTNNPDDIEYAKALNRLDYDQLIDKLFQSERFISEINDTLWVLELEILHTLDKLVIEHVEKRLPKKNS